MSWRDKARLMVELVKDVLIDSDGNATCKGLGDHELAPTVGWQFGFYSRSKGGVNGLVLKADGQGNTSFLIAYRDKQYELSLKEGEVGIKNAFDASVLLDEGGNVVATPKSGATVQLAGTDYALPKWDDFLSATKTPVLPGTPYSSLVGVLTHILTALTTNCVNGAPLIAPATPALANITDFIARLATTEYKSSKVKNG